VIREAWGRSSWVVGPARLEAVIEETDERVIEHAPSMEVFEE
jgi:hypothetical protein